jgi:hypothetical protein
MAYQSVVDYVRDAANAINPDGLFVHGRRSDGSIEYSGAFPQIHLYPFTASLDIINNENETSNIVMGFWQQDSPSSTPEEREAIIAEMDSLCRSFLHELNAVENITLSNIQVQPQYRTLSATLSGYAVTFRILMVNSVC